MCLRRVINPNITAMEFVVNTIIDIVRFYDNSDKVLNSDFIKRNVLNCLELTIEEIEDRFKGSLSSLRRTTKPKKGIIYKDRKAHSKETTYEILDRYYDKELDVKENCEKINKEYNYPISERTLYNYIKERGIKVDNSKLTDEELISMLDLSLTPIENYKIIKEKGYKIRKDRLYKIYKSVKNEKKIEEENEVTTINLILQNEEFTPKVDFNLHFQSIIEKVYQNFSNNTYYSICNNNEQLTKSITL